MFLRFCFVLRKAEFFLYPVLLEFSVRLLNYSQSIQICLYCSITSSLKIYRFIYLLISFFFILSFYAKQFSFASLQSVGCGNQGKSMVVNGQQCVRSYVVFSLFIQIYFWSFSNLIPFGKKGMGTLEKKSSIQEARNNIGKIRNKLE